MCWAVVIEGIFFRKLLPLSILNCEVQNDQHSLKFITEVHESFFGLEKHNLLSRFRRVLQLFINLEASCLHGSQPGLSSLGGNKGCRDKSAAGGSSFRTAI